MPTIEWHGGVAYVTASTLDDLAASVNAILEQAGKHHRLHGRPIAIAGGGWVQTVVCLCLEDGAPCPHEHMA